MPSTRRPSYRTGTRAPADLPPPPGCGVRRAVPAAGRRRTDVIRPPNPRTAGKRLPAAAGPAEHQARQTVAATPAIRTMCCPFRSPGPGGGNGSCWAPPGSSRRWCRGIDRGGRLLAGARPAHRHGGRHEDARARSRSRRPSHRCRASRCRRSATRTYGAAAAAVQVKSGDDARPVRRRVVVHVTERVPWRVSSGEALFNWSTSTASSSCHQIPLGSAAGHRRRSGAWHRTFSRPRCGARGAARGRAGQAVQRLGKVRGRRRTQARRRQTIVWGNAGEKELKARVLDALLKVPAGPEKPRSRPTMSALPAAPGDARSGTADSTSADISGPVFRDTRRRSLNVLRHRK